MHLEVSSIFHCLALQDRLYKLVPKEYYCEFLGHRYLLARGMPLVCRTKVLPRHQYHHHCSHPLLMREHELHLFYFFQYSMEKLLLSNSG